MMLQTPLEYSILLGHLVCRNRRFEELRLKYKRFLQTILSKWTTRGLKRRWNKQSPKTHRP